MRDVGAHYPSIIRKNTVREKREQRTWWVELDGKGVGGTLLVMDIELIVATCQCSFVREECDRNGLVHSFALLGVCYIVCRGTTSEANLSRGNENWTDTELGVSHPSNYSELSLCKHLKKLKHWYKWTELNHSLLLSTASTVEDNSL